MVLLALAPFKAESNVKIHQAQLCFFKMRARVHKSRGTVLLLCCILFRATSELLYFCIYCLGRRKKEKVTAYALSTNWGKKPHFVVTFVIESTHIYIGGLDAHVSIDGVKRGKHSHAGKIKSENWEVN
jgi:hypothetical protein